jgi:uncharacterized protein
MQMQDMGPSKGTEPETERTPSAAHSDADGQGLAVVTGASSGIGLAIARELVTHGYDVVAVAEHAADDGTAARIGPPDRAHGVSVDLATDDGVEQACDAVRATGRDVEVLVLNAGVGNSGEFARDGDVTRDLRLLRLNVMAPVHMAKRLMPAMVQRGSGRVLVTSSIAGTMPGPYEATYAASKAFLLSFAEAVAHEVKGTGVTVTALMPGATDTNFFARAGMTDTLLARMPKDDPAAVAHDGVRALLAGDDKVVAGSLINKAQVLLSKVVSPAMSAAMHARLSRPGSGDSAVTEHTRTTEDTMSTTSGTTPGKDAPRSGEPPTRSRSGDPEAGTEYDPEGSEGGSLIDHPTDGTDSQDRVSRSAGAPDS